MSVNTHLIIRCIDSGLFVAAFLYIALRGYIFRKPFLISMNWYLLLMVMIFFPSFVPLLMMNSIKTTSVVALQWLVLPMSLFLFIFFWRMFKGYSVYGIADQSFREVLISAMDKSKLKYKEDMNGIHIPSYDVSLKVTNFMGTGSIRIKGKDTEELMKTIVPILKKELEKPKVEFDSKPFAFYLGISLFSLCSVVMEIYLFLKTDHF